jgi:uncharacterized protein (TIRG00374 family)
MEATPAIDPLATVPESALPLPGSVAGAASRPGAPSPGTRPGAPAATSRHDAIEDADVEGMSLARRLRQPRTILSIAIPIVVIAIFVVLNGSQLSRVPGLVLHANPLLVLAALVVFYAGFPLRGLRWSTLLEGTGLRVRTRDSMEIIFLSWLVNCVVPAKLGDVYRAYLLKINSTASLSRTFGTVFIERVLDLFAIAILGLAAGYWSFRDGLPPAIQIVFGIGVVVVVVLGVGLFTMRNFGRQIIVALPFPHQVLELYDRFEEGVFGALVARHLPRLGVMTGLIWMTEAFRLFLVVQALSFADVSLGLSGAVFVALIGSLLTAVPLSPAGLGIVEAGVVGVLHVAYGVPLPEATAIALLDRVISVFSIIVFGSIAYAVSSKPRGLDRIDGSTDASTASTPA